MILKNSLRNVVRSPVKTVLFVLLLAAVTAFLSLGLNMWLSATQSIEAAKQAYKTIGIVEYRGAGNPIYDFLPIIGSEYVESFAHRALLAGFSEEITIDYGLVNSFKSGYSHSIVEFTPLDISEDGKQIEARILDVLRSADSSLRKGQVVTLEIGARTQFILAAKGGHHLEVGKSYLTGVSNGNEIVSPLSWSIKKEWWADLLESELPIDVFLETTEGGYLESDGGQAWGHMLQAHNNSLKTLTLFATNDLETILSFHQGKVVVSGGRAFSQEDYQEGNQVCIISDSLAQRLDISIGDYIPFGISDAWAVGMGIDTGGYLVDTINHRDIIGQGNYQVIGFYKLAGVFSQATWYGLMEDTVFIPQKSVNFVPYEISDNLVSFRLTTGAVEAFQQEMEQYDLADLNLTYYDQGYAKVSGTLASMRETALVLALISAGAGLGLVLLFSLLFVGRQQRSIAIMYSLGTGRKKALAFLMLTVAVVAGLAVVVGGLSGYALTGPVLTNTYEKNVKAMVTNTDYSGIYGEDTEANFQIVIPHGHHAPLAAAGGILVLALVSSGLFAVAILRSEPMQVLTAKEE